MKRLSLLYCAAAMLLSACANDPAETPEVVARAVVFEASNHTDGSRTEIGGMNILWQSSDAVGLFSPQISAAQNRQIVVEDQYAGQSRAVLKSDLRYANATGDHTFYAYYPYAEGQTDYTRVAGAIATQQDGTIAKSAFMWASTTVKPSDTPVGLQFRHPFAYIDIQVGTSSLYSGATLKEVRMKVADGKVLSGKFSADLTTGAVTFTEPATEVVTATNLVLDNTYQSAGYMVVNAEDLTGTNIDVYVTLSHNGQDIMLRATKDGRPFYPQSKILMQLDVAQMFEADREDRERQALIAIYNALNGDNWTSNQNWCSDKLLSEWSGVTVYPNGSSKAGSVYMLNISGAYGTLPEEVGQLANLVGITIDGLSGFSTALYDCRKLQSINFNMPNECSWSYDGIGNLSELTSLTVSSFGSLTPLTAEVGQCTKLHTLRVNGSGTLPKELGNLTNLRRLWLSNGSNFSGELPAELGNCTKLEELDLYNNNFTGRIPDGILQNENLWRYCWAYIVQGNSFDLSNTKILAEKFTVTDINGQTIDAAQIYASNEYTLLYQFDPGYPSEVEKLTSFYESYKDRKLGIIGYTSSLKSNNTEQLVRKFISDYGIEWPTFRWNMDEDTNLIIPKKNGWTHAAYYPFSAAPIYTLVDKNGEVVCYDFNSNLKTISDFVAKKIAYESSDFTQDGQVEILQKAKEGTGIDIVLMGDAFSDRQIADGTYMKAMQTMADNFFTEEPYKSFKDLFNVYVVKVVSKTEGYAGETALEGYFGEGTLVGGNDEACFNYALKAISQERMDEVLIIVAMNEDAYAGTCWMYYDNSTGNTTYGIGPAVAYFPMSSDTETFAQLLHHEACGHGFAKLADEYAYEYMGAIPAAEVNREKNMQNKFGWYKNVDFTDNLAEIRWGHFINDTRYAHEELGAYEGGLTYWSGVWRPTESSIMRYNTGGFNAPSREAIYYRIHKLAYGDSWVYDYETFVEWDARNRTAAAVATRAAARKPVNYRPTHPPVIVNKSWRDAK